MRTGTVWKYHAAGQAFSLNLSKSAEFLFTCEQDNIGYMWFAVDPGAPTEQRYFKCITSSGVVPMFGKYRGSFMVDRGAYMFHIFEVMR